MPGSFSFALFCLLLAVVAFVIAGATRKRQPVEIGDPDEGGHKTAGKPVAEINFSKLARLVGFGLTAIAIFLIVAASLVQVPTKEFGVVTTFGRPVRTLSNGLHWIAPWQKVTHIDAAIQTDNHTTDKHGCIKVRIAHQATACVDTSIRWRIQDGAANALFQDYRDFANIRDSLVTRDLNAALNKVFENFDPLLVDKEGNA